MNIYVQFSQAIWYGTMKEGYGSTQLDQMKSILKMWLMQWLLGWKCLRENFLKLANEQLDLFLIGDSMLYPLALPAEDLLPPIKGAK
jgi:hypothetical protein